MDQTPRRDFMATLPAPLIANPDLLTELAESDHSTTDLDADPHHETGHDTDPHRRKCRLLHTVESADYRENDEANRAAELTQRRSAHGPYDRIADTPTGPEKIFQEDCRSHPANRLKHSCPAARHSSPTRQDE
jgi:hypothetical protein